MFLFDAAPNGHFAADLPMLLLFFFFLVHRSSPNDHFSESFLIVRRKFFSPPAFLKHPLKSSKQLLCSLNHNTKTEKETKINNARVEKQVSLKF